jgi:hypothetical protein
MADSSGEIMRVSARLDDEAAEQIDYLTRAPGIRKPFHNLLA